MVANSSRSRGVNAGQVAVGLRVQGQMPRPWAAEGRAHDVEHVAGDGGFGVDAEAGTDPVGSGAGPVAGAPRPGRTASMAAETEACAPESASIFSSSSSEVQQWMNSRSSPSRPASPREPMPRNCGPQGRCRRACWSAPRGHGPARGPGAVTSVRGELGASEHGLEGDAGRCRRAGAVRGRGGCRRGGWPRRAASTCWSRWRATRRRRRARMPESCSAATAWSEWAGLFWMWDSSRSVVMPVSRAPSAPMRLPT